MDPARAILGGKKSGAFPAASVCVGEKSTRPDLKVKLSASSISATRVLARSFAFLRVGAHVRPIFLEVAKSLTSVRTNHTVSPEERRPRWSGSFTTSLARSTWPDVRNSFVILFSVDVSAAELTSIAKKDVNRTIMGTQMDLPKSLLDFMIAPLVGVTRI